MPVCYEQLSQDIRQSRDGLIRLLMWKKITGWIQRHLPGLLTQTNGLS